MARRRHEKGPWFWRGAIGTMLASVFGLFAVMAFNQPPALSADTNCRVDRKDPAHTILLIDQSDPFTENDLGWVQEFVDAEARNLPRYGRLTVMTPNAADPYDPRIVFTSCTPGSAEDANPILSNPRMVEDTWRDQFFQPLSSEIAATLKSKRQSASPLSEALFAAADRADFQNGRTERRVVLVSDLMQHSADYSFYKSGANFEAFSQTKLADFMPSMKGVDVVARIVPRREYDLPLGEVKTFWRAYFRETGATYESVN